MCGREAQERLKGWRVEVQGNGDSGIARDTGCQLVVRCGCDWREVELARMR